MIELISFGEKVINPVDFFGIINHVRCYGCGIRRVRDLEFIVNHRERYLHFSSSHFLH